MHQRFHVSHCRGVGRGAYLHVGSHVAVRLANDVLVRHAREVLQAPRRIALVRLHQRAPCQPQRHCITCHLIHGMPLLALQQWTRHKVAVVWAHRPCVVWNLLQNPNQ